MSGVIAAFPVYLRLAAMVPKTVLAYRFNIVMSLVSVLLQIYLLRVVWSAIYADRTDVDAFPLAQLLTYLKLSGIHRGLLLNFNVPLLKDGIKRMVY